jgi:hypothetical protein
MHCDPTNTPENTLGAGITEQQILEVVRKSGYPLQTVIASSIWSDFQVQEEWSFVDSDSGALRTLDILASREILSPSNEGPLPFVTPRLDLLIECKQSDLPFVFFMSATRPEIREFPYIAGLPQDTITITTDYDRAVFNHNVMGALSLTDHPFIQHAAEPCMSFSKCVRKGKDIELSGTDAYQSVVLPLVKALRYFKKHVQPPTDIDYFDCHIPLAIAVIDAPMIAARIQNNMNSLSLAPWVRVVRHEAVEAWHSFYRTQTLAIDVVHSSFFDKYLQQHAIPFAQQFASLALKHHIELSSGKGFAPGMLSTPKSDIETRLRPERDISSR